jgi:hypothetical protein
LLAILLALTKAMVARAKTGALFLPEWQNID